MLAKQTLPHSNVFRASEAGGARQGEQIAGDAQPQADCVVDGGFRNGRRISARSLILTAVAHVAILPLVFSLNYHAAATPQERLVTVNLAPPAAPTPPHATPQPPDVPTPPTAATVPPVRIDLNVAPFALPVQIEPPATFATVPAQPSPARSAPTAPAAAPAPALPAPPATITSNALDTSLIAGASPRYPYESRRTKEQGTVELLVIVGTDGRVETISVARSSGTSRLDQAALNAVKGWRWQPVLVGGQAVKVRGVVEIPFVLTSGRKSSPRADCDPLTSNCRSGDGPAHGDRRRRMDRRDGDIRSTGPDGEE